MPPPAPLSWHLLVPAGQVDLRRVEVVLRVTPRHEDAQLAARRPHRRRRAGVQVPRGQEGRQPLPLGHHAGRHVEGLGPAEDRVPAVAAGNEHVVPAGRRIFGFVLLSGEAGQHQCCLGHVIFICFLILYSAFCECPMIIGFN